MAGDQFMERAVAQVNASGTTFSAVIGSYLARVPRGLPVPGRHAREGEICF
jgi:hypothetical protein